jgi:pyruvate formate lyase activating enzyme
MKGRRYRVDEVLDEVEADSVFHKKSGGGLTVSGGEPFSQAAYLQVLLEGARNRNIHTAVDTSGYADWDVIGPVVPLVDLFLYDVKCIDSQLHKKLTGVDNEKILFNLSRLLSLSAELIVRIPIITGINDSIAEMEKVAQFIERSGKKPPVHLLPYHRFASQKYERIGRLYTLNEVGQPEHTTLKGIAGQFENKGISVRIFGSKK